MVDKRDKSKSIQPLDGGYDGYIETLEDIRAYVESRSSLTREQLKSWYSKQYRIGATTSDAYINSIFRSGLLKERGGRIKCMFPKGKGKRRDRRVVEIINENIAYVLDMLHEAREGATEEHLHKLGKSKYGLGRRSNINQIWWRRGWLQSARFMKRRDGQLYATKLGRTVLDEHFDRRTAVDATNGAGVNRGEFSGKGEGPNHQTLKEYVYKVVERICDAKVKERQMEYPLPSGDKVDVTAWNKGTIWHIEVKSRTSKDPDVTRGIYQSIKYAAVGKAMEKAEDSNRRVKSLLVVESKLSENVHKLADKLGVRVCRLPREMRLDLKKLSEASG